MQAQLRRANEQATEDRETIAGLMLELEMAQESALKSVKE